MGGIELQYQNHYGVNNFHVQYSYIAPATQTKCEITVNKWNTQVVFLIQINMDSSPKEDFTFAEGLVQEMLN